MTLTHTTAIRNGLANLVVDAVDAGTGTATGFIQITKTAGNYTGTNLLASIALANPSFGAASGGTATLLGVPVEDSLADNPGTATEFRFIDRDATEIFHGTVTATGGGGDMEMSNTTVVAGDAVRVNTGTYSAST